MTHSPKSFPARLRSLREQHRLSKTALGKMVGVSTTCIWNWEEGNTEPRAHNLVALSQALNTAVDYLEFGRSGYDEHNNGASEPTFSLAEVIASAKVEIANLAGIDPSKVKISLDY